MVELKGFQNSAAEIPTVIGIAIETKILVLFLSLTAFITALFLIKENKYKLHKQVTISIAILAIFFCLFPLHMLTFI